MRLLRSVIEAWKDGFRKGRLEAVSRDEQVPESRPAMQVPSCPCCGSPKLKKASNTHLRCRSCKSWFRITPAAADLLPSSGGELLPSVSTGFRNGCVAIIERDPLTHEESRSRPATAKELKPGSTFSAAFAQARNLIAGPRK